MSQPRLIPFFRYALVHDVEGRDRPLLDVVAALNGHATDVDLVLENWKMPARQDAAAGSSRE